MQVTKATFPAVFPFFQKLLQTCDFYAFDEEMSGISFAGKEDVSNFTPDQKYLAGRSVATNFSLMQCGICLFHRVPPTAEAEVSCSSESRFPSSVTYEARPFNFTLFPDYSSKNSQSLVSLSEKDGEAPQGNEEEESVALRDILLSPAAVQFHRRCGTDFQSWVYNGITYCNAFQRERWLEEFNKEKMAEESQLSGQSTALPEGLALSEEEEKWVKESLEIAEEKQAKVLMYEEQERTKEEEEEEKDEENPTEAATVTTEKDADAVVAPPARIPPPEKEVTLPAQPNRMAQQKLMSLLRMKAPNVTLGRAKTNSCWMTIISTEEKQRKERERAQINTRKYFDLFGFRLVFEELVQSRKPCVGHNCFLDFMFLLALLDRSLPPTLVEWKRRVHELFPVIYDTKYLSTRTALRSGDLFQSNYLGGLFKQYELVSDDVNVVLPLGFEAYDSLTLALEKQRKGTQSGPEHEAAYDALMTGTVFANLMHRHGFSGVGVMPLDLSNKVALFASAFALLLTQEDDEYIPENFSMISLECQEKFERQHFERCLDQVGAEKSFSYRINDKQVLTLLPPPLKADDVMKKLEEKFKNIRSSLHSFSNVKKVPLRIKKLSALKGGN